MDVTLDDDVPVLAKGRALHRERQGGPGTALEQASEQEIVSKQAECTARYMLTPPKTCWCCSSSDMIAVVCGGRSLVRRRGLCRKMRRSKDGQQSYEAQRPIFERPSFSSPATTTVSRQSPSGTQHVPAGHTGLWVLTGSCADLSCGKQVCLLPPLCIHSEVHQYAQDAAKPYMLQSRCAARSPSL